nr:unnamed protein product [Haemonchus contortus]
MPCSTDGREGGAGAGAGAAAGAGAGALTFFGGEDVDGVDVEDDCRSDEAVRSISGAGNLVSEERDLGPGNTSKFLSRYFDVVNPETLQYLP